MNSRKVAMYLVLLGKISHNTADSKYLSSLDNMIVSILYSISRPMLKLVNLPLIYSHDRIPTYYFAENLFSNRLVFVYISSYLIQLLHWDPCISVK